MSLLAVVLCTSVRSNHLRMVGTLWFLFCFFLSLLGETISSCFSQFSHLLWMIDMLGALTRKTEDGIVS